MAVKTFGNGGAIIDGPHIEWVSLLALRGMIQLEAHGLKTRRGSATMHAKRRFGWMGCTRTQVLANLQALIDETKRKADAEPE